MAVKNPAIQKEKRIALCISGARPSTIYWFKQRALEADLPFSKYINLLLDGIKRHGEEELKGGGGNRTRQLLANWFSEPKARRAA